MEGLLQTPLSEMHRRLGARMVPFAGYEMPLQYPAGVMQEHLATRGGAGLFDVSHMGQVRLSGTDWESLALAFERLVPMDVLGLAEGRQRYGFFTNAAGGIEDDLMFARQGDSLLVVVNAACKAADLALMRAGLPDEIAMEPLEDRALLALQGPGAERVLAAMDPAAADMRFMDLCDLKLKGVTVWASRSGYTGEDGFEISVPSAATEQIAEALLAADVAPIGLGARDSLRLEAGLCLYGSDIDAETTPLEASVGWAIQKVRRTGGARAGGFPGAEKILAEFEIPPARKRVGLRPEGRAPMRAGTVLFADAHGAERVGQITSGGFGPTVGAPVAMGYAARDFSETNQPLWGEVRGKLLPLKVVALPFVAPGFKR